MPKKVSDYDYYHAVRPSITADDIDSRSVEFYKKIAYLWFYLHPKRLRNTLRSIFFGRGSFKKTLQKLKRF